MEAGQLETTEYNLLSTQGIVKQRQLPLPLYMWLIVSILPPLNRQITETRKISKEGQGHVSEQVMN